LRVEDRLDLRRVEITHDVLCSVIGASRSVRREREALEESRRQLAAQQERERATRLALTRARRIAAVAVVITLAAVAGAIFGFINLRRAQAAEAEAARTRELAEQARTQAEKLVGFLSEDFAEELRPTGRVEVLAKLADKAVAYYDGLPPEMVTRQTQIYRGLALGRKGAALNLAGKNVESNLVIAEARKIFENLRAAGDRSDETAVGLALADFATARIGVGRLESKNFAEGVELLRPIVAAGRASRTAKLTLADLLQYLAHAEANPAEGVKLCEEARAILAGMGALDGTDLTAASIYGDVTDTQSRMVIQLGQVDEAERLAKSVVEIAEKVLEQRPADLRAMQIRYYGANMLGNVALDRNDLAKAETYNAKAVEAARTYTYFNPAESDGWNLLTQSGRDLASTYIEQGRLAEGQKLLRDTAALEHDPRNKTGADNGTFFALRLLEASSVQTGDLRAARAALDEIRRVGPVIVRERALGADWATITTLMTRTFEQDLDAAQGDYAPVLARAQEIEVRLRELNPSEPSVLLARDDALRRNQGWIAEAALRLGNFEQAATIAQQAIEKPIAGRLGPQGVKDSVARARVRRGQALLGVGRIAEARAELEQALAFYRTQQAAGANGMSSRQDLARALYHLSQAQAMDEDGVAQRQKLLAEAETVLAGQTLEARQTMNSRELFQWVRKARALDGARQ